MRKALTFAAALLAAAPVAAAEMPSVEWRDLSDRDVSPQGKAALSIGAGAWRHAESAHFVYHYKDPRLAETFWAHSEVFYGWVKETFGVPEDAWTKKVHVFVFESKPEWGEFLSRVGHGTHPEAFTTGWELFQYRDPFWLAPQRTLAHELTHVLAFRFLEGPIPLFLNEGFADFMAYRAIAPKGGGSEYDVRVVRLMEPGRYIPLSELAAATRYPEDKLEDFYRESELLVRFLILRHPPATRFYRLLREVSAGRPFERALGDAYGEHDLEAFEARFRAFAVEKR